MWIPSGRPRGASKAFECRTTRSLGRQNAFRNKDTAPRMGVNMRRLINLMIILYILCLTTAVHCDALESKEGLEVNESKTLYYALSLSNHSKMIVTEQEISSQVELRLRQLNIRPVSYLKTPRHPPYLHMIVNIYDSGFNVHVNFRREVFFMIQDKIYRTDATTWSDGSSGRHDGNNPGFIMRIIIKYLDQFLTDYLKANEK